MIGLNSINIITIIIIIIIIINVAVVALFMFRMCTVYYPSLFVFVYCAITVTGHFAVDPAR
jgi:hypothetical protein